MKTRSNVIYSFIAGISVLMVVISLTGCASYQKNAQEEAMVKIEADTGLKKVEVPNTEREYLGRDYRGYQVLYTGEAGDVWGRWAARVAIGEAGREAGGIIAFLTGSQEYGSGMAGSPMDRLLAKIIGQPLMITMILKHDHADGPRLDVLSDYSNIKPEDRLPKIARIGWGAGSIYSADSAFGKRIADNKLLMNRLSDLRGEYIRVDGDFVTLFWAGQENDFSQMINDHGDYGKMLNAFMDDLADIADAIPGNTKAGE